MIVDRITCLFAVAAFLIAPGICRTQESSVAFSDSSLEHTVEAGEASVAAPKRHLVHWNEFDGPFFTLRLGAGLLYDAAVYSQDDESKQQFDLEAGGKIRDFRLLLKGRLKFKRSVTWTCGIMYDGATDSWLFRETGIMVAVPELWGHLFIGRTKEGFSLNKVMSGYAGWTMERATITDATIPILADGVKWLGYLPNRRLLWNIGWYHDWLSQGQSFSTYDNQFIVRVVWLAMLPDSNSSLLHLGLNGRYGEADGGKLQLRSRPEVFLTPYFVDTGKFPADHSFMGGWEAYYRSGPFLIGTEYYLQRVPSPEAGNPLFHGGDIAATWLITGETREYNTVGGYFKAVSPAKTVFEGGPGAWEAVLRFS
jgi:phosphate-selective porin OprO/OprP